MSGRAGTSASRQREEHHDDPTLPAQYDFLLLQIVADDGMNTPTFASFDEARAYLDTEEYAAIRWVLASFEHH